MKVQNITYNNKSFFLKKKAGYFAMDEMNENVFYRLDRVGG